MKQLFNFAAACFSLAAIVAIVSLFVKEKE